MYSIGKFSLITRLTIKTLRRYHEMGLLVPDHVDEESNYRYYRESSVERAQIIRMLKNLEFSLNEIQEILSDYSEDEDILDHLEKRRKTVSEKIKSYNDMADQLDQLVDAIRRTKMIKQTDYEVERKMIEEILFAGHRFKGRYEDVGKYFGKIAKRAGRNIGGSPMSLYYDNEYKEDDADIEAGFPVKKEIKSDGISCRILPGGPAITLIHRGPYEKLGQSYEKIMKYITEKEILIRQPSREIYLKGPGMIFRGNPEKYLTEIQFFIDET